VWSVIVSETGISGTLTTAGDVLSVAHGVAIVAHGMAQGVPLGRHHEAAAAGHFARNTSHRRLWYLSPRALSDWLRAWPALACACGLPARADGTP
jgi:hypothetical protein